MTHAELVRRALKWAQNQCIIAFPELVSMNYEIPDVWGYGRGRSILIECKATRADFLADQKRCSGAKPTWAWAIIGFLCAHRT